MKIKGLKILNKEAIEQKAIAVLTYYKDDYFNYLKATPLEELVIFLADKHKIEVNLLANLGFSNDGTRILGCFSPSKKAIYVDGALKKDDNNKYRFTLAHELGHLVLHRKCEYKDSDTNLTSNKVLVDKDSISLYNLKKELTTDLDFLEWQANYFASCILLPKQMLYAGLKKIRTDLGLRLTHKGQLYVDNQNVTRSDYYNTLEGLSEYFMVSKTVIEIRLNELDLVHDKRNSDYQNSNTTSLIDIVNSTKIIGPDEVEEEPPF